jgi:bidirectional [NiFe] hydrogenase diaphorase subunit
MAIANKRPPAPNEDKRWKILDSTMRRHGYAGDALIESLHTAQEYFGFLDDVTMRFIGKSLNVPLSRVYGVATFYHFFSLKPQGEHNCVVCMGTACYIKDAQKIIDVVGGHYGIACGETSADKQISVLSARCIGACALAPAVVIDGQVVGKAAPDAILEKVKAAVAAGKKVSNVA